MNKFGLSIINPGLNIMLYISKHQIFSSSLVSLIIKCKSDNEETDDDFNTDKRDS